MPELHMPISTAPDSTAIESFVVESRSVPCDGGDGPGGHPRVWLRIEGHEVVCPYCSRHYVLREGAGGESH